MLGRCSGTYGRVHETKSLIYRENRWNHLSLAVLLRFSGMYIRLWRLHLAPPCFARYKELGHVLSGALSLNRRSFQTQIESILRPKFRFYCVHPELD